MKVSYKWLQTYFKDSLPSVEKATELFNAHVFEVEGVLKTPSDTVLDLKVLPDRAHYALCHRGIARELGAISGVHVERKVRKDAPLSKDVPTVQVSIDDEKLCRRYVARLIKNVSVTDAPADIKAKLEAIGARSINSIVDATNFVMFDVGQPLHAFDADLIKGAIKVRMARLGEKMVILDGREIELRASDLVIADDDGPIAIAGVKGGKRAEVTDKTANIILESANFDPAAIRRTSTRLGLRNDSSKRFENEITPALAYEALDRATKLIQDMSPDAQAGAITDVYPHPVKEWSIEADASLVRAMVGAEIDAEGIEKILASLDMRVVRTGEKLTITPPLERLDITIPEDIADEVGRIYGYEKLEARGLPEIEGVETDVSFYWGEKAKNALVDLGFSEAMLYTLVPNGNFEIAYPLASDKAALREGIAPKLAEALVLNAHNADLLGLEAIKIFEIGKVFPKTGERTSIAIGVSQIKKRKGVTSESLLKEVLAALGEKIGIKIAAAIATGPFGAIVEADFDALTDKLPSGKLLELGFSSLPQDKKYKPFSLYPYIARDIALFVPSGTSDDLVLKVIKDSAVSAARELLVKGPDLFDRFEKDAKVSYAFRMIFQSYEKTLSDNEVNEIMAKIYEVAKGKGWEVR